MNYLIENVRGFEVLDSRGNPTIEAVVTLYNGVTGRGIAPSGASTGAFEAHELRDHIESRYLGRGVLLCAGFINNEVNEVLHGLDVCQQKKIDKILIKLDGTENKSRIGANAILAVSIACANAASSALGIELYQYLGGFTDCRLPIPMMNILNGGAHAGNRVDIQEFMIMPVGALSYKEGLQWCCEVYHTLKDILKGRGMSTNVGDEGGFAPDLNLDEEAINLILEAVGKAGFNAENDFKIAIDAAASEWYKDGYYIFPKKGTHFSTDELIEYWKRIISTYPIFSIEDPLDEEDWDGWRDLTLAVGSKVKLIGDDLFVTNEERLQKGIMGRCGNGILIKPNQIGTLTETFATISAAKRHGFTTIISHRSGETEDTTIADIACACNAGYIKSGAPCRGERTCKYNRLLRIEESVGQF